MTKENEIQLSEINENVQYYWFVHTQQFVATYHGYEMLYFNYKLGEWVDWEDATMYPLEISLARPDMEGVA